MLIASGMLIASTVPLTVRVTLCPSLPCQWLPLQQDAGPAPHLLQLLLFALLLLLQLRMCTQKGSRKNEGTYNPALRLRVRLRLRAMARPGKL